MKKKLMIFMFLAVSALLFSGLSLTGCDFLNGDDNKEKGNEPVIADPPGGDGNNTSEGDGNDTSESDGDGGIAYIPDDDELESLLSTQPNPYAIVEPLIQTKWSQNRNIFSSLYPVINGHPNICGCVSLAYALRNIGSQAFEGELSAVLMDSSGNIAATIGRRASTSVTAGGSRSSYVTCSIPSTLTPGVYSLQIVTRAPTALVLRYGRKIKEML